MWENKDFVCTYPAGNGPLAAQAAAQDEVMLLQTNDMRWKSCRAIHAKGITRYRRMIIE